MGEHKEWQPGHVAVGGNRCKNQAHSGTAGGRKKPEDGLHGSSRIEASARDRLRTGIQYGWLKALLLCSDSAFWEMGDSRWEKAGLGTAERLCFGQVIKHNAFLN